MSAAVISHENNLIDGLLREELRAMNVPRETMRCSTANSTTTDELLLVSQAKSGCSNAFGDLYERHRRRIYHTVHRILGNREDAEDAVQRSFLRAFTHLGRFRGDSTFSTWLTRIAINEALMLLRQRRASMPLSDSDIESVQTPAALDSPDEHPSPEQLAMRNELHNSLLQAISNLREKLRSVILLKELQALTSAETARRLGLTVSAVKARVFHAKRYLRTYLERRYRLSSPVIQRSGRGAPLSQPARLPGSRKSIRNTIISKGTSADGDGLSAFLSARARLFRIAYRILNSAAEAEDIVQDVWIRWQTTDRSAVRDAAAFLSTMTTRLAINVVQSARSSRETSVESSLREPIDECPDPQKEAERSEALRSAVLVLLERLSPAERAAYVLREAFDYSYRKIANILRFTEDNARQLVTRARQHVADGQHSSVTSEEQRRFLAAFVAAAQKGALTNLESFLVCGMRGVTSEDISQRNTDCAAVTFWLAPKPELPSLR